jgi:hypothetical protein
MFGGDLSWRTALNLDEKFLDYRKGKNMLGDDGDAVLFSWASN